jgi:hypothetical protein
MKDSVRGSVTLVLLVVAVALLAGACSGPAPERSVSNPDPLGKIPAFKDAVRGHDRHAARQMVKDLDSSDPAVRLFAIVGLRRLTGESFGYKYYEDDHDRRPAIKRWQAWLDGKTDDGGQSPQRDVVVRQDSTADDAVDAPTKASGP